MVAAYAPITEAHDADARELARRRGRAQGGVDARALRAEQPRAHDEQIEQVARSIAEWGWTNAVLIAEDGTIIAGHARVLAAKKLGLKEIPVMVARGWSEAQIRAYVIADNKLTENGGWDRKLLASELQELAGGFDVSLIGFSEEELAALSARANAGPPIRTQYQTCLRARW